jgi:diamine N-acetyltransferase
VAEAAWTIRRANQADAGVLALIGAATFLETFAEVHTGDEIVAHCAAEHSPAAYMRLLGADADAWVAQTSLTGAPLGYAILGRPDLPGSRPGDLELKRIYTLSRLHGTGAGAALMAAVLAQAAARGAERLLLGVYSGNPRAIALYRKAGFERVGEHRFIVGETGYEDWILARRISRPG